MKKQYYSIQDVINFYAQREVSLDLQAISNCVREGFIHPLIYIDSRRVYACESRGKEGIIAIGFCHLSAYWNIGDDVIAVFDLLSRSPSVSYNKPIKKEDLIETNLFSWQTDSYLFSEAPNGFIDPKQFPGKDAIDWFIFLKDDLVDVCINNLFILQKDLEIIAQFYSSNPLISDVEAPITEVPLEEKQKTDCKNHHSNKRLQILKAACAVVFRYKSEIATGASIVRLMEKNINFLFENSTLPLSNKISIELINAYLKLLKDCNFSDNPSRSLSDAEKIWGATLSILYNESSLKDKWEGAVFINEQIVLSTNTINLSSAFQLTNFQKELTETLSLLL